MRDLEDVTEGVAHHGAPIAIGCIERRFETDGTSSECPLVCGVRVRDVDIEEGWERARARWWATP